MQFLLTSGLQQEKSSRATNMVYTQMLFALGFDKLVFGVTPAPVSLVGSSLIMGSVIFVAVQKAADSKVESRSTQSEEAYNLLSQTFSEEADINESEGG